jgi:hypothetical protein
MFDDEELKFFDRDKKDNLMMISKIYEAFSKIYDKMKKRAERGDEENFPFYMRIVLKSYKFFFLVLTLLVCVFDYYFYIYVCKITL